MRIGDDLVEETGSMQLDQLFITGNLRAGEEPTAALSLLMEDTVVCLCLCI